MRPAHMRQTISTILIRTKLINLFPYYFYSTMCSVKEKRNSRHIIKIKNVYILIYQNQAVYI